MASAYVITDSDKERIADMIRRYRIRSRGSEGGSKDPDTPPESSPFHIVKIPTAGIPALTLVGSDLDYVQSSQCDVYRSVPNLASPGDFTIARVVGYRIPVFNLSRIDVPAGFAIASREKFGYWVYQCPCVQGTGTGTGTGSGTGSV